MNWVRIIIFGFLMAVALQTKATEITFRDYPRFSPQDYLVYLLRKVPLAQISPDLDSHVLFLSGKLAFYLGELPHPKRDEVKEMLEQALTGKITIAGAWLDATAAQVSIADHRPIFDLNVGDHGFSSYKSRAVDDDPFFKAISAISSPRERLTPVQEILLPSQMHKEDLIKSLFDKLDKELLSRIDKVILFKPLSKCELEMLKPKRDLPSP